jgi:hypothetical protein
MTVDRKLPRYCGQLKDLKMESDGSFFRVTFKSNDRFDGTGFYANYQFTPVADAVTITRRRSSSRAGQSGYLNWKISFTFLFIYLSLNFRSLEFDRGPDGDLFVLAFSKGVSSIQFLKSNL